MNGCMGGWVEQFMDTRVGEWTYTCAQMGNMGARVDGYMGGLMDGCMGGWMADWVGEWMNNCIGGWVDEEIGAQSINGCVVG